MKKPVKVNPFDPIEPGLTMETYDDGTAKRKSLGVPVRLMLASQILSGIAAGDKNHASALHTWASTALAAADALIAQHNEDVEGV